MKARPAPRAQTTTGKVLYGTGLFLLFVLIAMGGFLLWLFTTAPEAREVGAWSVGPPLPEARGELATAVAHTQPCPDPPCPELERLFVLGGLSGLAQVEDRVAAFDPIAQEWTTAPSLPAGRHHPAAAGLGQSIYLSGGTEEITEPWAPEENFWRLDVGADTWEVLEPMPEARWGHRMVEHDGRLYVIGGEGPSARVLIFSPDEGWTTGAEMPAQRDHLSAVVLDGRIWALGGRAPRSMSRVDIYDPEADLWQDGPDLPQPTSGAAEGVVDDVILIFGGEEPALFRGGIFDRHWMLDTRLEEPRWEPAPPPPLAVHGADGAVFQGTVVIVGGATRHGLLSLTAWTSELQRLDASVIHELAGRFSDVLLNH